MRKLFLSSDGIVPETQKDFLELIDKDPKGLVVAFIPTAAYPKVNEYYIRWAIDSIEAIGMKALQVDLIGQNKQSLFNKLKDVDIIWVNGGNTFFLLDHIKKSGFDLIVGDMLDEGKIYFGVSAGSYVACPTIEAAKWKHLDDPLVVRLNNLNALNLVDFLVIAHYEDKYKKAVIDGAKTTNYPIVALTDKQAIIIKDSKYFISGPKDEGLRLNNFKEFNNE